MKPHEETWELVTYQPSNGGVIPEIRLSGGGVLFDGNDVPRATLATAAPEMARALLEIGGAIAAGTLDEEGAGEVVRRALAKAGVPLP